MGTDVAQGDDVAAGRATQHHRLSQDLVARQAPGLQVPGQDREVPDVFQETAAETGGAGGWALCLAFGHGPIVRLAWGRRNAPKKGPSGEGGSGPRANDR